MSELFVYFQLGFRHITDLAGMDHILFLLVLAAVYHRGDWKQALWVISAFTVGHSITLALAVTGALSLPTELIEFLIPVTIVATAIENIVVADRARAPWANRYRPVFAGVFGLVHGAGFANYLRELFVDSLAVPLLGFNLGIEAGQIVVLLIAAAGFTVLDRLLGAARRVAPVPAQRLRVVLVSGVVAVFATMWAFERSPW
jgi:hypothetical protein